MIQDTLKTEIKNDIKNTLSKHGLMRGDKYAAEILPLESADMCWIPFNEKWDAYLGSPNPDAIKKEIPCWSLASLLENIPQVKLDNIKQYGKKHWRCCAYFASDWHNSDWCDNPVDACYELILKLHGLKIDGNKY